MALEERFNEFIGPDFSNNGYCNAKYRAHSPTIKVTGNNFGKATLDLPSKLEVLSEEGKWHQHPVVFRRHGDLIIFHTDGYQCHYSSHRWNYTLEKFYEDAKSKGLT